MARDVDVTNVAAPTTTMWTFPVGFAKGLSTAAIFQIIFARAKFCKRRVRDVGMMSQATYVRRRDMDPSGLATDQAGHKIGRFQQLGTGQAAAQTASLSEPYYR
jgi:hypothetical protein